MGSFRSATAALLLAAAAPAVFTAIPAQAEEPQAAVETGARLTVDSTVGELLDNPASRAVLERIVPVIAKSPQIAAARDLPLRALAKYAPSILTDDALTAIGQALAETPGAVSSGHEHAPAAPLDPSLPLTLKTIPLWKDGAPGALGNRPQDIPALTVVGTDETASFGSAVIVAPGGGYQTLATGLEGRQVADWFAAHGVTAFVLTYRLASSGYKHPAQLLDAKRALRWVRTHAADYGISPDRIGIIGFSAGGNLAAMAETQFDKGDPDAADPVDRVSSRPDFAILGYPVIDWPDTQLMQIGLIDKSTPPASRRQLHPAENVRKDSPPTFIFHTSTDELVSPAGSTKMYDALLAAGVPVEMHIFAKGRHGMGLGMTDPALSIWPTLLQNWLSGLGIIGSAAAK